MECRIQILQDSVIKLVSKIAKNEDVSRYIPKAAIENEGFSINKVIEMLMEDEDDDAVNESNSEQRFIKQQARPFIRTSTEDEHSDIEHEHDQLSSPASISSSTDMDLSLGNYHSGKELATAVMDGGYTLDSAAAPPANNKSHRRRRASSSTNQRRGSNTTATADNYKSPSLASLPHSPNLRSSSPNNGIRKPSRCSTSSASGHHHPNHHHKQSISNIKLDNIKSTNNNNNNTNNTSPPSSEYSIRSDFDNYNASSSSSIASMDPTTTTTSSSAFLMDSSMIDPLSATTNATTNLPVQYPDNQMIDFKMSDSDSLSQQQVINPLMVSNLENVNTNLDDLWLGNQNFYENF